MTLLGTSGKACTMSWSSLPDDVVREILGKISLFQMAPITTTCSGFRTFYREKMAREQETHHQIAVASFGSERIACLCALIMRLLKREPLDSALIEDRTNRCWISADGVLHGPGSSSHAAKPEDIRLNVILHTGVGQRIEGGDSRPYLLSIRIYHDVKHALIEIMHDENRVPVALMQALLSGGLAKCIRDVKFRADVRNGLFSPQLATLLPFASFYKPNRGFFSLARMVIGVGAP